MRILTSICSSSAILPVLNMLYVLGGGKDTTSVGMSFGAASASFGPLAAVAQDSLLVFHSHSISHSRLLIQVLHYFLTILRAIYIQHVFAKGKVLAVSCLLDRVQMMLTLCRPSAVVDRSESSRYVPPTRLGSVQGTQTYDLYYCRRPNVSLPTLHRASQQHLMKTTCGTST